MYGSYLEIMVRPNPDYGRLCPPRTEPCDDLLGAIWAEVCSAFGRVEHRLMIVPDQGISILNLQLRDRHLLIENSIHQGIPNDTRFPHRIDANLVNY